MTVFPVTCSTLSAEGLGILIKEKYGLSDRYTCKLLRTGINHTYFLTDHTTKYVLRAYCHGWRSKPEILEEIRILNLLKENGSSVSFPIPDKNGHFIQDINAPEGMRHVVLFSFAEGGKTRFMDSDTCFSIGTLMAGIHNITANKRIERTTYDDQTLLKLPYEYAKAYFPGTLPEMEFVKMTSEKIGRSFAQTDDTKIKNGVVHMDIWYDNMNVTAQNKITLFDFDFCGNGPLVLDVAYFCKQLFHIETNKGEYVQKIRCFLNGYQKVGHLSEEALKLIPDAGAAVWIFYLGVQARRFDWSNIFLTENYLKMYVGKMKSWMDHHIVEKYYL